ncbi:MAG: bifunctional ADP-heptose synthase [Cyclobacteriaceae bacterium]
MKYKSLEEILEAFKNKTVLVLGDVMVDSYLYGNAKRISPEAPVPVLIANKREKKLGGAANVAMNVQALGAKPILCSIVGDDKDGSIFEQLLKDEKMPTKGIIKSQNRVTTVKHRVLSGSQHMLRVDYEDTHPIVDLDRKSLLHHIKNLMEECDLIIFQDYDKGTLDPIVIEETIKLAKAKNIPTAVDPNQRNFLSYKNTTLFKPNLSELKEGLELDFDVKKDAEVEDAIKQLRKKVDAKYQLVTLSDKGIFYQSEKQKGRYPALAKKQAFVSGAGDTVVSIAGLCLTLDLPLPLIAELANVGGGIVCRTPGVTPIDIDKLLKEAQSNSILEKYL